MGKVRIGANDASSVEQLLQQIGQHFGFPADIRRSANRWNGHVAQKMDRRDVQRIAWLLRDASDRKGAPSAECRVARQWASYLEGRIW
jgi:hypothetical protein